MVLLLFVFRFKAHSLARAADVQRALSGIS